MTLINDQIERISDRWLVAAILIGLVAICFHIAADQGVRYCRFIGFFVSGISIILGGIAWFKQPQFHGKTLKEIFCEKPKPNSF